MDFAIRIAPEAIEDFKAILEYSWANFPRTTGRFGRELLDHARLLRRFPRLGIPVAQRPGVRKLFHSPITIYYRIDEGRRTIEILHFWHGSRNEPDL